MSALVQYDSSSDDDEVASPKEPQLIRSEGMIAPKGEPRPEPENTTTPDLEHNAQLPFQGPVMGPSASLSEALDYTAYDEMNDGRATMSERDTIRYLTQATHPMTAMPPSPPGSPNEVLSAKFRRFLELKAKGVHFNEDLAGKDAFKNPNLLAVMMDRAGLSGAVQYSTSLPADVLDLSSFPAFAFKEELLKSQQAIRVKDEQEKKSQSAAGKRSIEFAPASTSEASSRNSTPSLHSKRKRP